MNRSRRYIGGEMAIDWESLWQSPRGDSAAAIPSGACAVTTGRAALALVARYLKQRGKPVVLMPSYLCSSMLKPFFDAGVAVAHYAVREDLSTDIKQLSRAIEQYGAGAVVCIRYFGFPLENAVADVLRALGLDWLVVEDCAHGWTPGAADPASRVGNVVFTSFRKYLPVPDGGFIFSCHEDFTPHVADVASGSPSRLSALGKLLRHAYLSGDVVTEDVERLYLQLFAKAELDLDRHAEPEDMSRFARYALARVDIPSAIVSRRRNFLSLLGQICETKRLAKVLCPVFSTLPKEVSPLALPVRVTGIDRDALRKNLAGRGIFCPVHWPTPPEISNEHFPDARILSREILSLPIDQRYGEEDMTYLAACLASAVDEVAQ